MGTGPGDEVAAASRSRMRAGDADREQLVDVLKAAFAQGRLPKDEFDTRVGRAFAARTYADITAVLAGIPAAPARVPAPPRPARPRARRSPKKVALLCAGGVLIAELFLFLLIITIPVFLLVDLAVLANLVGLPLAVGFVHDTWRASRAGGQLASASSASWQTVSALECVSAGHSRPHWRP
ncbi:MAG TPA: DUF1707 domain-containing protein [Streptosporangiaceae bacterium]|nr:DUF1707 domain-containing protein [Streptosporangiaceae bacterium]